MSEEEAAVLGGEIRSVRRSMGQSTRTWAEILRVSEPTVKNWEKSKYSVPDGVAAEVLALEDYTRRCVAAVADAAADLDDSPMVVVWRMAEEMPAGPARTLGPAWWETVAVRARERVPDIIIGNPSEIDSLTGSRDRTLETAITPSVLPPPSHP